MSTIRPVLLQEFIGQTQTISNLKIAITSAVKQVKVLGHVLLGGPAGVGKTTIGMGVIPHALTTTSRYLNCAAIEKPPELTVVLASMGEGQILFLDELHALPVAAREHLLTAMEDQRISVKIDEEKIINVDLAPFTVVGATTRIGLLDAPLRSRFQHRFTLTHYSDDEATQIVIWHVNQRNFVVTTDGCAILGAAAQGSAREAVNLVEATIDTYMSAADTEDKRVLTASLAKATVDRLGYKQGLHPDQIRYLQALSIVKPLGLKQLESILNEQACTIEDVYEPWLLRNKYIEITPQGRRLTNSLDAGTKQFNA